MAENGPSAVESSEETPKASRANQKPDVSGNEMMENFLRPILLDEYSYEECPESLKKLQRFLQTHNLSASRTNIVIGLIFLLMLESGFVPSGFVTLHKSFEFNYKRLLEVTENLALDMFLKHNDYIFKMNLVDLQQFEVKLICVVISDDLVVNCFVKGIEHGAFNVLLDPLTYFTSSRTDLSTLKFQHLDRLSREIKDNIAFPVKCSILQQNGIPLPCFEDLPTEILLIIIKKLNKDDVRRFGRINCKCRDLSRDYFQILRKKVR